MKSITVTIDTENEAFKEFPFYEAGNILEEIANKFKTSGRYMLLDYRDSNGNKVAKVTIEH